VYANILLSLEKEAGAILGRSITGFRKLRKTIQIAGF
jgi:hypothetical protein